MKTFKVETHKNLDGCVRTALLKQAICDHYEGLPVMRGMAFQEDSENRFWGETSSGVYCARILAGVPEYAVLETLKQEFSKLKNVFPDGLDFFVFFPLNREFESGFRLLEESVFTIFGGFKSVRFLGFHILRALDGKSHLSVEEFLYVEKRLDPIENPLPDFSLSFEEPERGSAHASELAPGPATLSRQEIEEFFEIGLEIKRIRSSCFPR